MMANVLALPEHTTSLKGSGPTFHEPFKKRDEERLPVLTKSCTRRFESSLKSRETYFQLTNFSERVLFFHWMTWYNVLDYVSS